MPMRHAGSRSYYEHNYSNFGREVLRSDFMRQQMRDRAYAVLLAAQSLAPVETGEYLRSFQLTTGIRATGRRGARRVYARVTNTSDHAMAVEFGWGKTPRYRVLGHALGVVPGDQVAGA
jgi:hypothetical protein